ncbi:prolipoprotein diacylglyceryl transferase family protein [Aquihabitans sp. McL0605]|uniref:prolipoprotein diacylglyceryl transferase family protein n=1 Tax=Aquihabitans sp. McL0605 TaxID=3415671 RepID=UPI003CFA516F
MTATGAASLGAVPPPGRLFGRRYLHLGRHRVPSYVVLLEVGCVLGTYVGVWAAAADGLDEVRFVVGTALLLVPALVGSRLWFVLGHRDEFRRDPSRVWRRAEGGSALYGGLVLSAAVSVPVLALLDLPYWRFWDAAALTMLVGLIPTRLGCAMNGCCTGRATEGALGVRMPDVEGRWERRYPSPLLEAGYVGLILVAVLAVAVVAGPQVPFAGARFLAVVGAYAAGRIALGATRGSGARSAWGNAVTSVAILLAVAAALAVGRAGDLGW